MDIGIVTLRHLVVSFPASCVFLGHASYFVAVCIALGGLVVDLLHSRLKSLYSVVHCGSHRKCDFHLTNWNVAVYAAMDSVALGAT